MANPGAILSGEWARSIEHDRRNLERAVKVGVTAATEGLKTQLRQQVRAAGLGDRLANAVQSEVYPKRGESLRSAGRVFAGSKAAARVLESFSEARVIRARNAKFLAIPLEAVPRKPGRKGGRMSPVEVEAAFNVELRFVPRAGKPPLLVADDLAASRTGRGFRARSRGRQTRASISVAMFVLLPAVSQAARISPAALRAKWLALLPELVSRALPESK
jgi:hypothetical protein